MTSASLLKKIYRALPRLGKTRDIQSFWKSYRETQGQSSPASEVAKRNLTHHALRFARQAEAEGRWQAAILYWDYLRAAEPFSMAAERGAVRCAHELASFSDDALDKALLRFDPNASVPHLCKVDVLIQRGRTQDALRILEKLDFTGGSSFPADFKRSEIAILSGRFDEALSLVRKYDSLLIRPDLPSILLRIGSEALCAMGRFTEARDLLFRNLSQRELTNADVAALYATVQCVSDIESIDALLGPANAPGSKTRLNALKHQSQAFLHLGRTADAIRIAETRFIESTTRTAFGAAAQERAAGWSLRAEKALKDLQADMKAGGFPFFLISGTLLGCFREGRLLLHDKDIDVGIMAGPKPDDIRNYLRTTGRFRVKPILSETVLRAVHANGTSIDIFWHWLENGKMMHQGAKTTWWNSPFELVQTQFLGEMFSIPSDPGRYLRENYGEWRTPAPNYDTFLDTPNMTITDGGQVEWYLVNRLLDAYTSGKAGLFARIWKSLNELAPAASDFREHVKGLVSEIP